MEPQTNSQDVFHIKRVQEVSFSVNEDLFRKDSKQLIRVRMSFKLDFNIDENLMRFLLTINLHYEGSTDTLVQNTVQNVFFASGLNNYIKSGFPLSTLLTIISESIAHARAFVAKNIASTVYEHTIVPLIKPENVATQFFNQDISNKEIIVLPLVETGTDKAVKVVKEKKDKKFSEKK